MRIIPRRDYYNLTAEQEQRRKGLLVALDITSSTYMARGDEESRRIFFRASNLWQEFWRGVRESRVEP